MTGSSEYPAARDRAHLLDTGLIELSGDRQAYRPWAGESGGASSCERWHEYGAMVARSRGSRRLVGRLCPWRSAEI
jgi:hypothetical protein